MAFAFMLNREKIQISFIRKMKATNYLDLLQESENLSNLTIVCNDGILVSHKIILVSVSSFMKHLLSEIPLGDDATLYLPDFSKSRMKQFLFSRVFSNTVYEIELAKQFKAPESIREIKNELNEEKGDMPKIKELCTNMDSVKDDMMPEIKKLDANMYESFQENYDTPQTPAELSLKLRIHRRNAYERAIEYLKR